MSPKNLTISNISELKNIDDNVRSLVIRFVIDDFSTIPNLKNLESLIIYPTPQATKEYLQKHKSVSLSFEHFPDLPNLKYLELYNLGISSFEHFPDLPNLLHLDVFGNKLSSFLHLPKLENLRSFFLYKNKLSSFLYFPEFPSLVELHVGENQIKNLKDLPRLINLTHVILSDNLIENIEDGFNSQTTPQIKYIYASKNYIESLDPILFPETLRYLDIKENQFKNFDFGLPKMAKVVH